MKTKTVINKFKKIGIEFTERKDRPSILEAKSETQLITIHSQGDEVATLSTCDAVTNYEDRLNYIYTDCSYKTFHDSAKSAVEWVQEWDARNKRGA